MNWPPFERCERGGERHLDAELVGPVRLALADAFDLGRMQRIDFPAALAAGAARAPGEGQRQRLGEDCAQAARRRLILRTMSRMTRPR